MKIILLDPLGVGKGTQVESISNRYSTSHTSTGDISRESTSGNTPLGVKAERHADKGRLVPDEVTISMVKDRLQQDDCKNGYLLDGFSRTINQVEVLQELLSEGNENLNTALPTEIPTGLILERMIGGRVCPSCRASYHIKFNPLTTTGKCGACGSDIIQRKDDTEGTVPERLGVCGRQAQPLIDFYKERDLFSITDRIKATNEVFEGTCDILGSVE